MPRKKSNPVTESIDNPQSAELAVNEADHQNPPDEYDQLAAQHEARHIVEEVAESTKLPDEQGFAAQVEARRMHGEPKEREPRADPFPFSSKIWPDGYAIRLQESDSRRTLEIQFGDGSPKDQPKNFAKIKPFLKKEGMRWNGECAWVIDLAPVRGSFVQREDAKEHNKNIRTRIEEVVFPAVVAMEEELRGQIDLTEDSRQRIQKAAASVAGRG